MQIKYNVSNAVNQQFNEEYCAPTLVEQHTNHISIPAGHNRLPIEISIIGQFPMGSGEFFLESALNQQETHPLFIDEYNEPSALIGKTTFAQNDPTAIYTFGVDTRDLVFHRHEGHRVITGVTGRSGCILKFSLCTAEEAELSAQAFLDQMVIVEIPGDCLFTLRFNGTIYHQFGPKEKKEKAFFAVSVHTDEAKGLTGALLEKILANEGSIPLLTEPASDEVMKLLAQENAYKIARVIELDFSNRSD